ncbi:hypothetical protein DIURU_000836 [Diutina rugosa]|uniref:Maintenance of telomere capping protein 4 n=1 Tax=Diutina rugosa TaxID=5481 RepID=A0A642V3M3_DIURU|nr:uncharacterized protein DIURU_000836 [Diutina rugosa]KAA8907152.1 hypothetical protein DIURU_000836 [Diutina rugosa]
MQDAPILVKRLAATPHTPPKLMASPLAQLRLSNAGAPRKRVKAPADALEEHQRSKSPPSRPKSPPIVAPERHAQDDFELDMTIPTSVSSDFENSVDHTLASSSSSPAEDEEVGDFSVTDFKKANELATLFLDTRKILRADCNIVDPLSAESHTHSGSGPTKSTISVSRQTHLRAEKVKSMIAVKYMYIQRQYDLKETKAHIRYPGVEGVYNPLQIIRNRKIRAKYHEYPGQLSIKTLSLACNVFSKHNNHSHSKRPWKMIWSVELNEFLSDPGWRHHHWHELVNGKGELWFPEPVENTQKRQALYDKLFEETSSEDDRNHHQSWRKSRHRGSNGTDNERGQRRRRRSKSPMKLRDRMSRNLQRRHSSQLLGSSDEFDSSPSSAPPAEEDDDGGLIISVPHQGQVPMITVEDATGVNDVHFNHVTKEVDSKPVEGDSTVNSKAPSILGELERSKGQTIDTIEKELTVIRKDFAYLGAVTKLRLNYLLNVYPEYTHRVDDKLNQLMKQDISQLLATVVTINDNQLQIFERLFTAYSKEVSSVLHLAHDKHSIEIDHLLSASDRSISEINTSMSLESRKLSERLDRLSAKVADSCGVTERWGATKAHLPTISEGGYRWVYFILETLIVMLLWLVWVVVNVYRAVAYVIGLVIRVIRFVLLG